MLRIDAGQGKMSAKVPENPNVRTEATMTRTGLIAVLTAAVILAGCNNKSQVSTDSLTRTEAQTRKSELLTTIAAKYENPEAHYKLGKIYHREGSMQRAEFHYNVAMGFDPMHHRAQAAMVRLMKDRQEPQKAQVAADMYINQAAVNSNSLMALGRGFQRERLDDYALRCYQQAQTLSPNSAPIYKQLGYFYLGKGDKVRGESNLRRSFELNPDQPDVASDLGRMGVKVQVPPRKTMGILGPIQDIVSGTPEDETIK